VTTTSSLTPPPKLPLASRLMLIREAAAEARDIAWIGESLGELGRSVDDLPEKLTRLSRKIDKLCSDIGASGPGKG
jgi:hypothetical protein